MSELRDEARARAVYAAFRNSPLAQVLVERWGEWESLAEWARACWLDVANVETPEAVVAPPTRETRE